jgi:hypothetical protein
MRTGQWDGVKLCTADKNIASILQMPKVSAHDSALALLAITLVFVVLFWRLGTPTFWDPDEAHYAETTREMIATADWSAPFYNEQPFFDKPVLFHQLQGAAMRLVSDPELGARLVPALAALGLVAITWWFGVTMVSRDVGIAAALMLAACPGVFGLARYAILDTLFTMFMFGGAACLAVAALRDRPRLQWLGYVAIGFAVQTKGPLALVLCGLTMVLLMASRRRLRCRLLGLQWVLGLAVVAAVSSWWFVYMYVRFKDGFVNGYILDENVRLFAASRFANQPGFSFYIQILAAAMLPWTGLLIGRLVDNVRAVTSGTRLDGVDAVPVVRARVVRSSDRSGSRPSPRGTRGVLSDRTAPRRRWCRMRVLAAGTAGVAARRRGRAGRADRRRRDRRGRQPAPSGASAASAMAGDPRAGRDLCRTDSLRAAGLRGAQGRTRRGPVGGIARAAFGPHRQLSTQPMEPGVPLLRRPPHVVSRGSRPRRRVLPGRAAVLLRDAQQRLRRAGRTRRAADGGLRARRPVGDIRPRALAHGRAARALRRRRRRPGVE